MWKTRKAREEFIEAVKSWEQSASEGTIHASIIGKGKDADRVCACADVEDACSYIPVCLTHPSNLTLASIAKLPWSFDQSKTR